MDDAELKAILQTEHQEWMTKIREIVNERNAEIDKLKIESYKTANPSATLQLWSRSVKIASLRRNVEARLGLREEYGQNEPALLTNEVLAQLGSELETFINNATKDDPRSLADAGDIKATIKARIAKLALKRKWWQMSDQSKTINVTLHNSPGAVVNVDSIVSHIQTNAQAIAQQGGQQFADAISKLAEEIRKSTELGETRAEALQNIEVLSDQAKLPAGERKTGVIKSIYLGLSTALTLANTAATAWHTYGPIIAEYFNIK
jgi:hypothetical protein